MPSLSSEAEQVSHLLRRAGFGGSRAELAGYRQMGLSSTIDRLLNYDQVDDSDLESMLTAQALQVDQSLNDLQRWWLLRMIYTKRPLLEKMVLFWHGLLTSDFHVVGKGPAMFDQNQLYRTNAVGSFHDLITAVSRDPAMLTYLDSRTNHKGAPNENYARELMELFTLGVGNYTETDVRESARAFTGWGVRQGEFYFNPNDHDTGQKTFLGQQGPWNGDDIIDIIMQQPAAATHICQKLWAFFAYDDPEPALLQRLVDVFRANDTQIKPVLEAMFTSNEFYSSRAVLAKVRGPAELVATAVRTLGATTDASFLPKVTAAMGQVLFHPPNVAGWPGQAAWIDSSTLFARINFANLITSTRATSLRFDPSQNLDPDLLSRPTAAVAALSDLMFGGTVSEATKSALTQFLQRWNASAAATAETDGALRALLYLAMSSPEFQVA